ncbi:hypothetical protein NP493_12g10001 [Ridgeia piscesae]|nr:hypothetical protein NP493_12g10001 [Ridgeia piscesae]
MFTKDE